MIVRVSKMRPCFGAWADDLEEREQPLREREPEEEADDGRDRADDERLENDRGEH